MPPLKAVAAPLRGSLVAAAWMVAFAIASGDLAATIERLSTVMTANGETTITEALVTTHTRDGEESNLFDVVDALNGF